MTGLLGESMSDDSKSAGKKKIPLQNRLSSIVGHGQVNLEGQRMGRSKALDAVLDAPKSLQREWQKHGATGILTKFPIFVVAMCLLATTFFVYHSGFLDGTSLKDTDEPSLKVNGDLEVYLQVVLL